LDVEFTARVLKATKDSGNSELDNWIEKVKFLSCSLELTAQPFAAGYPDGSLFLFNQAFCELTGYSKDELLEKVIRSADLTPPEWRGYEAGARSELHRTGKPQRYEKEYVRKDGKRVQVKVLVHEAVDSRGNLLFYYSFVTDISEDHEGQQEPLEMLRLAQQVARAGTFEWNIQTGVNRWTPELEAMYGLQPGTFPGTEEAWEQLVYPEDREEMIRRVNEAIDKGGFEGEWRVVWPDGSIHWIYGRSFVFKDKSGKPLKLIGINIDITDRKRAEEALRENEARRKVAEAIDMERRRLFDILENLPAMICLLTPDYHVAFTNRSFRERFGESRGRHCYEYCFGRNKPCEFCESYKVLKTGRPHKWEVTGPDGSIIEAYDFPFTDVDGSPMILEMDIDITERKRAEKALQESEARFRALATASSELLYRMSPDWGEMRQLYSHGYLASTEMPSRKWLQEYIPQDELPRVTVAINTAIRTKSIFELEHRVYRADGSIGWTFSRAVPILDANGAIVEWFGAASDVTDFKQVEMEREIYTRKLEEAKEQAELYMDLMGHDINNYNQAAMGFLELALTTLERERRLRLDDKLLIERPLAAIQSSSKLIENVRKLQWLVKEGVKTESIDLCELLKKIDIKSYSQKGREITINIPVIHHCHVEANELIKDIFVNLITNSIKHSDEEKPLAIDVNVEPVQHGDRKYHRCVVEDNGPGIPDELKPKLFHRFIRGATTAHGKGLGLYLIRTLVEGYGGKVWVEDRVKGDHTKGARFVVMLPAAKK
jgi:PAS domain S-box-containing protein